MKKLIIGGLAALAAVISVGMPVASAEPAPVCTTVWRTMYTVPIGTHTTCFNPDGSYQVCNKLGTDGNGPGTCFSYPAPPAGGVQPPTFAPPVPGVNP